MFRQHFVQGKQTDFSSVRVSLHHRLPCLTRLNTSWVVHQFDLVLSCFWVVPKVRTLWHWCRRWGCNRTPKVLIWWKSGRNPIQSGQNPPKSGQNLWEPSKTPWKSEQKWRPICFDLKIMAPELTRRAFFEVTLYEVFFGQVWENPSKIPSHPQKFACSYTYDLWDEKWQDGRWCKLHAFSGSHYC